MRKLWAAVQFIYYEFSGKFPHGLIIDIQEEHK
jgi:hypothetical protein